jgi:hypothetical protein
LDTLEAGDGTALAALVRRESLPCSTVFAFDRPECTTGEPDGTLVESYAGGKCNGVKRHLEVPI